MHGSDGNKVMALVSRAATPEDLDNSELEGTPVFALDEIAAKTLTDARVAHTLITEGRTESDYQNLDWTAMDLGLKWFAPGGNDFTVVNGLSVGALVSWDMSYFFAEVMRSMVNVGKRMEEGVFGSLTAIPEKAPQQTWSLLIDPSEDFHAEAARIVMANPSSIPVISERIASTPRPTFPDNTIIKPAAKGVLGKLFAKKERTVVVAPDWCRLGKHLEEFFEKSEALELIRVGVSTLDNEESLEPVRELLKVRWKERGAEVLANLNHRVPGLGAFTQLHQRIDFLLHGKLPLIERRYRAIVQKLRELKASLVILQYDVGERDKSIAWACRELGIPCLVLIHGLPAHPIGFLPVYSSAVAVYTEDDAKWYEGFGVPREKLHVTGPTTFMRPTESLDRGRVLESLGVPLDAKVIAIAHQHANREHSFANFHWPPSAWKDVIRDVSEAASKPNEWVLLKIHPNSRDADSWQEWVSAQGNPRLLLVKDTGIGEVLAVTDVLVAAWSTTVIEAALFHVPVLIAKHLDWKVRIDFAEKGMAEGVETKSGWRASLDRCLYDEVYRQTLVAGSLKRIPDFVKEDRPDALVKLVTDFLPN